MATILRAVSVTGLFGENDLDFELPSESAVAFLHGPNGTGKSTVLRMLFNVLTGSVDAAAHVEFSRMRLVVTDRAGADLEVLLVPDATGVAVAAGDTEWHVTRHDAHDIIDFESHLALHLPELVYLPNGRWWDDSQARELALSEVLDVVAERAPIEGATGLDTRLAELLPEVDVEYIGADRLRNDLSPAARQRSEAFALGVGYAGAGGSTPAIHRHRAALARRLADGAAAGGDAALADQTALFANLANAKFRNKSVVVDDAEGFVVLDRRGHEVPPSALSSGEQHQLLLLFRTIFRESSPSLFLVDEPELSLHVAWQEGLVDDLETIAAASGAQFVLATHSPVVIGDRYSLLVDVLA